MSTIKYLKSTPVLTAAPANEDQTTLPTDVRYIDNVNYQANVSGNDTPELTLRFQTSIDYQVDLNGNVLNPGNWVTLQDPPGTDVEIEIGETGSVGAKLNQLGEPYVRAVLVSTFTGAGVQTITTVADDGGSLNSTYFMIYAQDGTAFYVWLDVDSGGVDPMVPDATGIPVAISEDDTAAEVATAVDTALNPMKSSYGFTSTINIKTPTVITVTLDDTGPYPAAADSEAAPTGFAFALVTPDTLTTVYVSGKGI